MSFLILKSASTLLILILLNATQHCQSADLSPQFYAAKCPQALAAIHSTVQTAIAKDRRMAASLIRLQFHDCFVHGCDASVLLDQTSTSTQTEKTAIPNRRFTKTFKVIEDAKSRIERLCPGVVSCSDIIAVAARDASASVEGPTWDVKLGRRDSDSAFLSLANSDIPGPKSDLQTLISDFQKKGLTARDMVALSGAHTLGFAQCFTFRDRIYDNGTKAVNKIIDSDFARKKKKACPAEGGDRYLAPLDTVTPKSFDNNYFKTLMRKKGLLESDQVLYSGGSTDGIVEEYSRDGGKFSTDFAAAMVKMGDIGVITGSDGQIRKGGRERTGRRTASNGGGGRFEPWGGRERTRRRIAGDSGGGGLAKTTADQRLQPTHRRPLSPTPAADPSLQLPPPTPLSNSRRRPLSPTPAPIQILPFAVSNLHSSHRRSAANSPATTMGSNRCGDAANNGSRESTDSQSFNPRASTISSIEFLKSTNGSRESTATATTIVLKD
ncbi:Lignin-forming anionic peroxidase [Linum perenne]